jgi:hypothetical protein
VLQKVVSDPDARQLLLRVDESLELEDEVTADIKAFVLSKIYAERMLPAGRQELPSGTN